MIRITVELIPFGIGKISKSATAYIWNDGTGDMSTGNYKYALSTFGKKQRIWKHGEIKGFKRLKFGVWDLLYLVLKKAVGSRNV